MNWGNIKVSLPRLLGAALLILALLRVGAVCRAQDDQDAAFDEGWFTPDISLMDFTPADNPPPPGPTPQVPGGVLAIAEAVTPEIATLARGLENDPKRIFDYVHDHIRYTHYFGSHKGAQLTLLERSGNSFDQCALLIALLRAAGLTAIYQFGTVSFPYSASDHRDYQHWVGTTLPNTNWNLTFASVNVLNTSRGYPLISSLSDNNSPIFHHVWVKLTISGTDYLLDPSFKVGEPIAGIDLDTAMNLDTNAIMTAAGGTATADYVENLSETGVRSKLRNCATNLLATLQNTYPNASVEQIAGGRQIISSVTNGLGQGLAFAPQDLGGVSPISEWQYIPTNLMAVLKVSLPSTNKNLYTPGLGGDRLSLTFDSGGLAQLWQQDTPLFSKQTTGSSNSVGVTLTIQHPFGLWSFNGTNTLTRQNWADQSVGKAYWRTNANYALLYGFEADPAWLTEREQQLDTYRSRGLADSSRQVLTETLNVMGLSWLVQTELTMKLFARQRDVLNFRYHRLGRMGQETGRGYYVDVYAELAADRAKTGTNAASIKAENEVFQGSTYFASALEHGIIEQSQASGLVAASTVKILQLANQKFQRIYLANSGNWSSGANVSSHLVNYDTTGLNSQFISQGYNVMLPADGSVQVAGSGTWAGSGYVALQGTGGRVQFMKMVIGGGYQGGYVSDPAAVPDSSAISLFDSGQPNSFTSQSAFNLFQNSQNVGDPVNIADGTFRVTQTDLALGSAPPRGLSFTRYYSSSRRFSNIGGMTKGWVHSFCGKIDEVSAPQPGLGATTPQQMVPMLVATRALLGLYDGRHPDPKNWLVTALIAKWGVDQLLTNGISVSLGNDTIQFVQQPDGTFTPPANCTYTLTRTNSAYRLLERHGSTFQFGGGKRLTNIVDQYDQRLSISYYTTTGSFPQTVTDAKGRALTFTYLGSNPPRLSKVTDSENRSVSFSYVTNSLGQRDLASVTDPENKTTTYLYDTNHQIVATKNALSQLVVTNFYDGFGRITTQYTQGDLGKMWQIYWSGWQNIEQDPAGGKRRYFYDDKSRLSGIQDPLGNTSQVIYDGQDHAVATISPLNETNQFVYDGNHNLVQTVDALGFTNTFVYDAQNNLVQSVNARGSPSGFGYNGKFQLTGATNGAGDWVTFGYNSSDGTLSTRTDPGGTTSYGYDSYGQLNAITYPGGLGTEAFLNDALGDVLTRTNGRGFATSFQYNARRELTNTIAPTNLTAKIAYDANDNVSALTDARGFTRSNTWSVTRHLTSTILPPTPQGVPVITNIYDSRDWVLRTLNPLVSAINYTNDPSGRLAAISDPLGRPTRFGYDSDGRRVATTNAANEITRQTWSARGELIRTVTPHPSTIGYVHDAAGNQVTLTNRNGKAWRFDFDGANRLVTNTTPLSRKTVTTYNNRGLVETLKEPSGDTTTLLYDGRNRLTNRTDGVGTVSYGYDAANNVTNVTETVSSQPAALNYTYDAYNRVSTYRDADGNLIQYGYDANGNVTTLVYPGGKTVTYFYDSLNRLTNVTDWVSRKTSFTYDLASRVRSITRPNGTVRLINYDAAGQTTNIIEKTTTGFPIAFFRLNWNNAARVEWEFAAPLPHTNTPATRTMTFDDDNRLATFNGSSVGYDLDGNMTSGPALSNTFTNYTFDARNRLLGVGNMQYGYDPGGNRTAITNGTNVVKLIINPNAALSQVLMQITNGVTNYYVYGLGLLYEADDSGNTKTYHYDYRGSTIAISGDNGIPTDRIEYSRYGMTTYRVGNTDTPFLYNGRYGVRTDPNGLLYMRARYYNPYLCRFVNADPSGFSGGLNLYAYANGNPISLLDPFGLDAVSHNNAPDWLSRKLDALGEDLEHNLDQYSAMMQSWSYLPAWTQPINAADAVTEIALQDIGLAINEAVSWVEGTGPGRGTITAMLPMFSLESSIARLSAATDLSAASGLETESSITLWHGTSTGNAASITSTGFRAGADGAVFFADDVSTARFYGLQTGALNGEQGSVLQFTIPQSLADDIGLSAQYEMGAARGFRPLDIPGASGFERIMSGPGINAFNQGLQNGTINSQTFLLRPLH